MTDIVTVVVILAVGALGYVCGFMLGWSRATAYAMNQAEQIIRDARAKLDGDK